MRYAAKVGSFLGVVLFFGAVVWGGVQFTTLDLGTWLWVFGKALAVGVVATPVVLALVAQFTSKPMYFGPGEIVGDGNGGITGTRAHEFERRPNRLARWFYGKG